MARLFSWMTAWITSRLYALGNFSPYSFYVGYSLPRRMASLFDLLSFGDGRNDVLEAWKQIYIRVLKKATLVMNSRRLVIKNPLNTPRIPVLLVMFPIPPGRKARAPGSSCTRGPESVGLSAADRGTGRS